MSENAPDSAGVIVPPPLIFVGGLVLGLILNVLFPIPLLTDAPTWIIGALLIIVAVVVAASAFAAMRRAGTSPDPSEPTRAMVVTGPFRFTRNPIYLSFTLIYLGLALIFKSVWLVALLVVVLIIIDRGVIAREENYLARKFGDEYLRYKSRVRRWL